MGAVQDKIDELEASRDAIRSKLVSLGLVADGAKLSACATAVSGIVKQGNVSAVLDTTDTVYTIPAGYHAGGGKVQVVPEEKSATPTASAQEIVPSAGRVLSKVTVAAVPVETWTLTLTDGTTKTVQVSAITDAAEG